MDKVSIVITNYNQGHLLERSVNSALKQDYPEDDIEIIIVDDGSTDNSPEILSIWKDHHRIRTIFKHNGGTASARNTGVKAASHSIIAFLDADDEYMPLKIKRSSEEIMRFPSTAAVYSDYIEIFPTERKRIFKPCFDKRTLMQFCIVSTNSVVRKEAIEKVGGFDEHIKACEDYDLWLRFCNAGYMIRHIAEVLFVYYNHGENKTHTFDKNLWGEEEKFIKDRAMKGRYYVEN